MSLQLDISDLGMHHEAAKQLIKFAGTERVFLFDAPMGSGKTTFIKSVCSFLGVTDTMSSPTYGIVNEYNASEKKQIYHFDLYRLTHSTELFELGFEEYLDSGSYVFIEWPELAIPFLNSSVNVKIITESNNRYLRAQILPLP